MSVDESKVRHIARLARIALTDDEVTHYTGEINGILQWIEQLAEVDASDVEPMTSVVAAKLKMREDVVTDGGIPEKVMKNAPDAQDGFFTVPKVVE
jgi:aspartyl-tRNA(Asn)/glutamyl-tRNA(Gln) amidotransferase subunit C